MKTSVELQEDINQIDREMEVLRDRKRRLARQIEEVSAKEYQDEAQKRRESLGAASTQSVSPDGIESEEEVSSL